MKTFKRLTVLLCLCLHFPIFSQTVPPLLSGIWEGNDRYIYFIPQTFLNKTSLAIMLKTLYGWYYDRTAENELFTNYARTINSITVNNPEKVDIQYSHGAFESGESSEYDEAFTSGVWELNLIYEDKSSVQIPVAVIDDNLYLNFAVKRLVEQPDSKNSSETNLLLGFWQGIGSVSGITVSMPQVSRELTSFYITENAFYHIRYWQTDMEYSPLEASFSDGEHIFSVPKHIQSAGKIYTCVNGKSLQIRNVEKSSTNLSNYILDKSGTICAFGKPYAQKKDSSSDNSKQIEEFIQLSIDANSRRKPDPKPLFPPSDLNWHLDDIQRLEKGNEQIESVRQRQKEFARQSQAQ